MRNVIGVMQRIMSNDVDDITAEKAEDWVIATGKTTTVRDFVKMAFAYVGIKLKFVGHGVDEVALVDSCEKSNYQLEIGKEVVAVDKGIFAHRG